MQKGLDRPATLIQEHLKKDPFSGHLFVFRGKNARLPLTAHCLSSTSTGRLPPSPPSIRVPNIASESGVLRQDSDLEAASRAKSKRLLARPALVGLTFLTGCSKASL
jgi:hypothetical protein